MFLFLSLGPFEDHLYFVLEGGGDFVWGGVAGDPF